jgi:replicative DNA helicase
VYLAYVLVRILLRGENQPTDLMTVISWLSDRGTLETVGGTAKLIQLLDCTVSAVNIDRYAALVMDKYLRRDLGRVGFEIADKAYDNGGNRSYELGDVARELYKMAGDLKVPVLALSQLNRAVEGRNNKRPTMADLSQSGILEMVADNVILVYRDEYYNPDTLDPEILELIVGKARHGRTGTAKCLFDKSFGLLKNLA